MKFDTLQPQDTLITRIAFFLGVLEYAESTREAWMQAALKMVKNEQRSFADFLEELFLLQLTERVSEEHRDFIIARKQEELHEHHSDTVHTQAFIQLEKLAPKLTS